MIIIVAALEFATQAKRDEAVALIADVQRLTRLEEPGCFDYCFAPDPAEPTRIQVYELWENSDVWPRIFSTLIMTGWQVCCAVWGWSAAQIRPISLSGGESVYTETGDKKTGFFQD